MEMENSKTDLLQAMERQDNLGLAQEHYLRCLLAKSFFAFVQNMVTSKIQSAESYRETYTEGIVKSQT